MPTDSYQRVLPMFDPTSHLHSSALLIGDVIVGPENPVAALALVKADMVTPSRTLLAANRARVVRAFERISSCGRIVRRANARSRSTNVFQIHAGRNDTGDLKVSAIIRYAVIKPGLGIAAQVGHVATASMWRFADRQYPRFDLPSAMSRHLLIPIRGLRRTF